MSGPTISLHIVVAGTRRSWTREEKRAILNEAQSTAASISSVARRHGLTPSLLFRGRREAWDEERAAALPVPPPFVPLALPAPAGLPTRDQGAPGGAIEVELADGHRLRAEAGPIRPWCGIFSRRCWIDDPRSLGLARMAGHRPHGHEEGLRRARRAGAGPPAP